jgi:hypothetical protein
VVELGWGEYNNTYRVELADRPAVVLRVAPEPPRQYRSERELMRNEYATIPYLAAIAEFIPRTLAVDFTHEIIGRDYPFQAVRPGRTCAGWAGRLSPRGMGDILPPIRCARRSRKRTTR